MPLIDQHELVERRRENLRRLCKDEYNDNRAELARMSNTNANQINFALSDNPNISRPIGENLARKLEKNLGKPVGFLDRPPHAQDAVEIAPYQATDILENVLTPATAVCGLNVTRNWVNSNRITAPERLLIAEVASDHMAPEIHPGEQVIIEWLTKPNGDPVKAEAGFSRDGIYIINTKVGPVLRRVARTTDAKFAFTSPNAAYEAETKPSLKGVSFYARLVTPLRFGS